MLLQLSVLTVPQPKRKHRQQWKSIIRKGLRCVVGLVHCNTLPADSLHRAYEAAPYRDAVVTQMPATARHIARSKMRQPRQASAWSGSYCRRLIAESGRRIAYLSHCSSPHARCNLSVPWSKNK